jgi:dipeptidyl aminopeptidase/acylaminoacyl peptidase
MTVLHRHIRSILSLTALLATAATSWGAEYPLTQYLNVQSAVRASISPNNAEMLYLTDVSGVTQAWRMPLGSGYQSQVTFRPNGVAGAWWSTRDLNLMVVAANDDSGHATLLYMADPYGGEWKRVGKSDGATYKFLCWSRDGSRFAYSVNVPQKKELNVYEYNVDVGHEFLIYKGEGVISGADFSPDNHYLVMIHEASGIQSEVLQYDRETLKTRSLTNHSGAATYARPAWDGPGKGFGLLTNEGQEFTGFAYWPLDSSAFRWIENGNQEIEEFAFSHEGTWLAWSVNDGYSRFHVRNLLSGAEVGPGRLPDGVLSDMVFTNDGGALAFSFGSGGRTRDLWLYETGSDKMNEMTYSATGGMPNTDFIPPEQVQYSTFDNRNISALWYTPAGATTRTPVIVMVHDGPASQVRPRLEGIYQYFLSRGYSILEPDIRGSAGHGKTFEALDNGRKRMEAVRDIEYAGRWLASRPEVDSTRMVIIGVGYGGFVTLSSLEAFPSRWAAGVCLNGVTDFITLLKQTEICRRPLEEAEFGSVTTDSAYLAGISPALQTDKIKVPLMIIRDSSERGFIADDDRMVSAIKARGGVVEQVVLRDASLRLSKRDDLADAYSAMAAFLYKHVAGR